MAGPGGRIAPDGRPAQAPGVGKNAKRHDLEAPATPGLHGSDLQQGDVQMLEQGQRVAPRPKKTQGAAAPAPARRNAPVGETPMEVPDPLEFAAGRIGGNVLVPSRLAGLCLMQKSGVHCWSRLPVIRRRPGRCPLQL